MRSKISFVEYRAENNYFKNAQSSATNKTSILLLFSKKGHAI